jgi:hypothetical protein
MSFDFVSRSGDLVLAWFCRGLRAVDRSMSSTPAAVLEASTSPS